MPLRSRRSMKIRPPWSRRRCTQPATRTRSPTSPGAELTRPAGAVAVGAQRLTVPAPRSTQQGHASSASVGVALLAAVHVPHLVAVAHDHGRPGADAVGLLQLALAASGPPAPSPPGSRRGAAGGPGESRRATASGLASATYTGPPRPAPRVAGGQQDPLDAGGKADPGRGRPAELLDQQVVAPAAAQGALRAQPRRLELEHRARVVVQPAHQRRSPPRTRARRRPAAPAPRRSARRPRGPAGRAAAARPPSRPGCPDGRRRTRAAGSGRAARAPRRTARSSRARR